MEITFKQLEIFRWVVVAGSITKASHRFGVISMTPAGEYWFKSSADILARMSAAMSEHEKRFKHSSVVLRLGATPALRGRFTAAALIAQTAPGFVKFELVYDVNSHALVEQLRMHQINFAIVAEAAIQGDQSSFAIARLFEDKMAWAVPASVSDDEIRAVLHPYSTATKLHPILSHYIEIDPSVPTRAPSDDWFRNYLPRAMPTFAAPTFAASVELVAADHGTCHLPLSLLPNLSEATRGRIKLFLIDGMNRTVVLAMRKHLLTHGAYTHIFNGLSTFCRAEYLNEMNGEAVQGFQDFYQSGLPDVIATAAE